MNCHLSCHHLCYGNRHKQDPTELVWVPIFPAVTPISATKTLTVTGEFPPRLQTLRQWMETCRGCLAIKHFCVMKENVASYIFSQNILVASICLLHNTWVMDARSLVLTVHQRQHTAQKIHSKWVNASLSERPQFKSREKKCFTVLTRSGNVKYIPPLITITHSENSVTPPNFLYSYFVSRRLWNLQTWRLPHKLLPPFCFRATHISCMINALTWGSFPDMLIMKAPCRH